jgi:hypothetical protein
MWALAARHRPGSLRGRLVAISLFLPFSAAVGSSDLPCPFELVSNRIAVIVGSDHQSCPLRPVEHPLTNPAAIIGETGVIPIDPGSSLQTGRLVWERLQEITDKPVVAVFNSHFTDSIGWVTKPSENVIPGCLFRPIRA